MPEIVLTADPAAARVGVAEELRGADAVGEFARYARGATPALLEAPSARLMSPDAVSRMA